MQKVLLASTALVLSTGWAMADVTNAGDGVGASITLNGIGKMGVIGNDLDVDASIPFLVDADGDIIVDDDGEPVVIPGGTFSLGERDAGARFFTDVDIEIDMVGVTDGGLEFGVRIDLDEGNAFNGETQGGEELRLRGPFGNLYMGDTDGAFDWAMTESIIGGAIGDVNEHAAYSGNSGLDTVYDGQIARYDYSFGGFGVAVSATIDDFDEGDPVLGIGAKYSWEDQSGLSFVVGAGYQNVDSIGEARSVAGAILQDLDLIEDDFGASIWGVSGQLKFGGITVIADYSQLEYDNATVDDGSHWGVALGYEWDAWLVAVNYGHNEDFLELDFTQDTPIINVGDAEAYALTANYDLGGGAVLQGAIAHNDNALGDSFVNYSFGVSMAF